MLVATVISVASVVVAAVGVAAPLARQRRLKRKEDWHETEQRVKAAREQAEQDRLAAFLAATRYLKDHRGELTRLALREQQEASCWDKDIPLLTMPGWIPERPLALDEVVVHLAESASVDNDALDLDLAELLRCQYWPADSNGRPLPTYSSAIAAHDMNRRLENRPSYRLLAVAGDEGSIPTFSMTLMRATYFDGIDTSEPLAFEAALRRVRHESQVAGPYRAYLADPFKFSGRAAMPGINSLTIRLAADGPRFFMHRRGKEAGLSAGAFNVAPAGEFQPQIDDPTIWHSDFDILKNIVREYCEEFLGQDEADGRGGTAIDYGRPPYSYLFDAAANGSMRVRFLGVGLDPVSWKPEILTVCVFEESTFSRIFAGMSTDKIDQGTGGYLLTGARVETGRGKIYEGQPFVGANIAAYTTMWRTLAAGDACLRLAHRWIDELVSL